MTPENVIEQWAEYFNNGDLEGITSFIIEIVTLLPTFLPKTLIERANIWLL